MSNLIVQVRRRRLLVSATFDALAWVAAYLVFAWLRFDQSAQATPWLTVALTGIGTAVVYLCIGGALRLHQGRARVASLEEMMLLGTIITSTGLLAFLVNLVTQWVPRSVPIGATFGALVLCAWARASWRRMREIDVEGRRSLGTNRALVVGAGEAGQELIGSMLRDGERTWHPVGLLDDDPMKRHRRIRRVPVVGRTSQLEEKVEQYEADTVILALPSASADTIEQLRRAAVSAGVAVKVLPATTQLLSDQVGIRDLRDINLTDVLGRNQLDTDIGAIAGYLAGRKVLVTGAGGSIGSELCRQIHRYQPDELVMLDRDESALHAVQLSIHGRALLDSDDVVLCDIRDADALNRIFADRRPDVVFHAAALKHLPMLEQYPAEAVKTNIIGTRNVIDAADLVGVQTFVNISTDKAANPCSVLGYSKRIAERITADRAVTSQGTFVSVRFGNVLGSRGSVLTAFAKQIAEGGPVTVTDPDVTRYFMTIEEACQLVVQAAAVGSRGDVMVLDMGEPVRILDVANHLIEQSGNGVKVEFTGLREGEKLHEDLFGDDESEGERVHPLISHVSVPPVTQDEVSSLPTRGADDQVRQSMADLCAIERHLDRTVKDGLA